MGKSLKKLVVGLLLVGLLGLVVSKLTGGSSTAQESEGIDRVNTRESEASGDVELDVEVETDDDELEADLDLPATSGGMDTFDYLAVFAAGAKAAYEEYRTRA